MRGSIFGVGAAVKPIFIFQPSGNKKLVTRAQKVLELRNQVKTVGGKRDGRGR
jgi:hypothetical protein